MKINICENTMVAFVHNNTIKTCAIEQLFYFAPPGKQPSELEILAIGADKIAIYDAALKAEKERKIPYIRVNPKPSIICQETGEQFDTLTAAISRNGGRIQSLSNHLRQRPGYRTVNGFTYKYSCKMF